MSQIEPSPPSAQFRHLRTQLDELLRRYDTLTKRIAALETDIGRELDSERRLVLEERRADLVAERDTVVSGISQLEQQLAGGAEAKTSPGGSDTSGRESATEATHAPDERGTAPAAARTPAEGSPPHPDEGLRRDVAEGKACAFVGSGLSIGAGLPGWYELIEEFARRTGQKMPPREWATAEALIGIAETYVNRQGLFDLIATLKDRLDTTGKRPTPAHEALARLPINVVFTANYDDLLERAYREAGKRVHVVVQDTDLPFMRRETGSVNIIKLYGTLDRPDTIVLARQQYDSFFLKRPQMIKLLETQLGTSTMMYLGWSRTDPYFSLVFGEMQARFGDLTPPGYASMFDVSDDEQLNLERRHIRLVRLAGGADRTTQLAAWLESLAPGGRPPGPSTRAAAVAGAGPTRSVPSQSPAVSVPAQQPAEPPVTPRPAPSATPHPDQVVTPSSQAASAPPDLQLLITLSPDNKTLSYILNSPGGDYNFLPLGSVSLVAPPRELLQRTFDRLSTLAGLAPDARTPAETAQAIRELADIGSNLYDELFPLEFKREYPALREKHRGGNLLITANDPWIPWEIVRPAEYDRRGYAMYDDPPLCESFQLARWVAGPAAPSQLALRRATIVQPQTDLQAASVERDYFAGLPAAAPGLAVTEPLQTVADTLAAFGAGQTQLYHFACHGNFDLTDPNDSKLKLADGFLSPAQLTGDRKSGLLRARPLVFVNACHAGERGFGLTRLGGWAERFIASGASAFVGSLWEINDDLAFRFAVEFYDRFFGLAGHTRQPLGQAFREARLVLKELDPANPTWLAYVLYGNPRAELSA